jgi:ABC-type nitrate/sulfonate/bicarbonate transport system substrate-binding protein
MPINSFARRLAVPVLALALSTTACGSDSGSGGDEVPSSVKIGIGGAGVIAYAATYVAKEKGYLDEELKAVGSKPEFVDLEGSVAAIQALATGDVDFVTSVTSATLNAVAEGAEVSQVVQFNTTDMVMMTATPGLPTDPAKPAEMVTGRKWGIPGVGSTAHLSALNALAKWGYKPSDVQFVEIGHVASSAVAVENKMADYYWLGTVGEQLVADKVVNLVLDLFDPQVCNEMYGGPYATAGLFSRPEYVQSRSTVTKAIVKAHTRALEFIQQNKAAPDQVMAGLPADLRSDATLALLKRVLPGYSPDGVVKEDAVQRVIDASLKGGLLEAGTKIDTRAIVNNSYRP